MKTNPGCASCDYFNTCSKELKFTNANGEEIVVKAKSQSQIRMRCINKVQEICKDCYLFKEKKCASWKVLNGSKKIMGTLSFCPKKVSVKEVE